ncbi:MAG: hypothetical protein BAJALOKI1v1_460025 [Promethearchaeota archaeon]|nr:MAG: hypothetical protein BAJALOKI1v1_460025 [Candidatus Lokiarchaeota archaeon]
MKAEIYSRQNRLEESLELFLLCDNILESIKRPTKQHTEIPFSIAKTYHKLDDIENAILYAEKSLEQFNHYHIYHDGPASGLPLKFKVQLFWALSELYYLKKDYRNSLKYYHFLLDYYQGEYDEKTISEILMDIAIIFEQQEYYEKAIELYMDAFYYLEKRGESPGVLGHIQYDIGRLHYDLKSFQDAHDYLEKALTNFETENVKNPLLEIEKQDYYQDAYRLWKKLNERGYL